MTFKGVFIPIKLGLFNTINVKKALKTYSFNIKKESFSLDELIYKLNSNPLVFHKIYFLLEIMMLEEQNLEYLM